MPDAVPQIPVWARRNLVLFECPKSFVSGQSIAFVEAFALWKRFGRDAVERRTAREVEAFLILDSELAEETRSNARQSDAIAKGRGAFG
jgi:hypothetical protein